MVLIVTGPLTEEELRDWRENQAREAARLAFGRRRVGVRAMRVGLWCLMVACLAHGGPWSWATLAVSVSLHVLGAYVRRV